MSKRPKFSSRFDLNRDGNLSPEDLRESKQILDLELAEEKADTQRRMGWTALVSMVGFTGLLFSPLVSVERVAALSGAIDMFYISMAGVVGAVVGVTAWISKSRMETYSEGYTQSSSFGRYGSTY